jgi:hypothetical protein
VGAIDAYNKTDIDSELTRKQFNSLVSIKFNVTAENQIINFNIPIIQKTRIRRIEYLD